MGVPGRDRLQKIGQTSGCTPKIQSSCAVKAIGPIVVCCLELRFDAASAPGEPCGPGSSYHSVGPNDTISFSIVLPE